MTRRAPAGSRVAMALPGGTRIEGEALGGEVSGRRLRVSKTSNKKDVAKGGRVIPEAADK